MSIRSSFCLQNQIKLDRFKRRQEKTKILTVAAIRFVSVKVSLDSYTCELNVSFLPATPFWSLA